MDAKIFRVNYKSDFILTLISDAGWMTPFCIKFWTGAPSQAYYAQYDGTTYTNCAPVEGEPTKLTVQFDDHHMPIGNLKYQVAYHFTVADFPNDTEDEVLNQANITTEIDGETYQVMLDFTGETAPEIQFSLPAYANEAQRIANELQREANELQREANEEDREANELNRQRNEGTRIENERERVQEFQQMKGELEQATRDASAAAENANEKAVYAKNQGDYAKQQGDYAKDQGDIAKADHLRAEEDHRVAGEDHTQAGNDHTRAGEDHTQAGNDHTRAGEDHTQAGNDHTRAGEDHTRAESDHAAVEVYVDSLGVFDLSKHNAVGGVLATYADLNAALTALNALESKYKYGGMSMKFVQSSDNKYVQYICNTQSFSVNPNDWSFCGENIQTEDSYGDLEISDDEENTIVLFENGQVRTKYFNSATDAPTSSGETFSDLDLADKDGNAIVCFEKGHIITKEFDSSKAVQGQEIQYINNRISEIEENISKPKGVILDTDWWTDVDDAVAIRCLLWAERCGMIDLVGVCIDAVKDTSGQSLAAYLNEEGRGGLVIGMDKQATDYNRNPAYHQYCIDNWPYYDGILSNNDCEDCVSFYRRALVNASSKIDIICTGYGNALQRLLNSTADNISPLTGAELITQKVDKLWWMAGTYPSGTENNFNRTARSRAAGADICANWPTPIVFLGFEVGQSVITGTHLSTDVNSDDFLHKLMVAGGYLQGNSSWDPMTVLLACYDNLDISGYSTVQGANVVEAGTGANAFTPSNQGKHFYVVKKHPDWWYAYQIDKIISLISWPSRNLGIQQLIKNI